MISSRNYKGQGKTRLYALSRHKGFIKWQLWHQAIKQNYNSRLLEYVLIFLQTPVCYYRLFLKKMVNRKILIEKKDGWLMKKLPYF